MANSLKKDFININFDKFSVMLFLLLANIYPKIFFGIK